MSAPFTTSSVSLHTEQTTSTVNVPATLCSFCDSSTGESLTFGHNYFHCVINETNIPLNGRSIFVDYLCGF